MKSRSSAFLAYGVVLLSIAASVGLVVWCDRGLREMVGLERIAIGQSEEDCSRLSYGLLGLIVWLQAFFVLPWRYARGCPVPRLLVRTAQLALGMLVVSCVVALAAQVRHTPIELVFRQFKEHTSTMPCLGIRKERWVATRRYNYDGLDPISGPLTREVYYEPVAPMDRDMAVGSFTAITLCDKDGCDLFLAESTGAFQASAPSGLPAGFSKKSWLRSVSKLSSIPFGWGDEIVVATNPTKDFVLVRIGGKRWECRMQQGVCIFEEPRAGRTAKGTTVPRPWLWGALTGVVVASLLFSLRRRLARLRDEQERLREGALEKDGRVVLPDGATLSVDSIDRLAPGPVVILRRAVETPYREAQPLRRGDIQPGKRSELLETTDILLTRLDATVVSIACLAAAPLIGGLLAGLIP